MHRACAGRHMVLSVYMTASMLFSYGTAESESEQVSASWAFSWTTFCVGVCLIYFDVIALYYLIIFLKDE